MPRLSKLLFSCVIASALALFAPGCSSKLLNTETLKSTFKPSIMDGHATEQRVITRFTDALVEDKEQALRGIVSTRFEHKAMRSKDSYRDLEMLNLPKARLEVVESKPGENGGFETVAKEEKSGTKYQFVIVRDAEKNRWVVDDILLRQQKSGTRATKSVVEVMDLLLTVREFLDVWKSADRSTVQLALAPDLRTTLESLPDAWFQNLVESVTAEYENEMARRPEAQMNESDAVVKLPSKNGFILLKVLRDDDQWLVSDIEVRKRKSNDHPGSVLRQARALQTVTGFLDAYQKQDLTELAQLTEEKFYRNALRVGDLSMIALPSPNEAPQDSEIQSFAGQLTIMIPAEADVVRIDLTTPEIASSRDDKKNTTSEVEAAFIVAGVTIYNRQTQQQRNLKSAFTAPAHATLFLEALDARDLPVLKEMSCKTLTERVWSRIRPEFLPALPLQEVPRGTMTLQRSQVRGEVTELEFLSEAGRLCSVIMRDENGTLKVEDVEFPDQTAQVASLKVHLELSMPRLALASAWQDGNLDGIRRSTSMDFNRLVWSNVANVPSQLDELPALLMMPVQSTQAGDHRAIVQLSDGSREPVSLVLLREDRSWVIDEVVIRHEDGSTVELRKSLRQEIAQQFLTDPSGGIQQATFNHNADKSGVVRASGESIEPARGNLTMPSPKTAERKSGSRGIDMTPSELPETEMRSGRNPSSSDSTSTSESIIRFGPAASTRPVNKSGVSHANLSISDDPGFSERAPAGPVLKRPAGKVPAMNSEENFDAMRTDIPPRIRPRSKAEVTQEKDVVLFRGAAITEPTRGPQADENVANKAGHRSMITDPSQSPIEIPME